MMYEDLVMRLKKTSMDFGELDHVSVLLLEAADAIEELSKLAENGEATYEIMVRQTSYIEELKQKIPHWIPVTERFPTEYRDVLCYYEYFRFGEYNCMFRTIDRGYYGDGRWGGEAGQGYRNKVLAWMPLPEPPKDGE